METDPIELTNFYIITLATSDLGGIGSPVEMEDIAIKAYEIAPTRFCWKKYTDRIDLRIVHYSLQSATRQSPPLLEGDAKRGYMVTSAGMKWISEVSRVDLDELTENHRKFSQQDLINTERVRLSRTNAYRKWMQGEKDDVMRKDFQDFTRVNEYFPEHLRQQRFTRITNAVNGDDELARLWEFLLDRFTE